MLTVWGKGSSYSWPTPLITVLEAPPIQPSRWDPHTSNCPHPLVERRRRFNINDRIKELGMLIPKANDL